LSEHQTPTPNGFSSFVDNFECHVQFGSTNNVLIIFFPDLHVIEDLGQHLPVTL